MFGKYSVNLNDLKFKIDTFVKGDVRLVEFISKEEHEWKGIFHIEHVGH